MATPARGEEVERSLGRRWPGPARARAEETMAAVTTGKAMLVAAAMEVAAATTAMEVAAMTTPAVMAMRGRAVRLLAMPAAETAAKAEGAAVLGPLP